MDVVRVDPAALGMDPFQDMRRFLGGEGSPLVLDVGANVGQTVERVQGVFPGARIHSFEPSPGTFEVLKRNCAGRENVTLWNRGVGSAEGRLMFQENERSDMSSFLAPGERCWGRVVKETEVEVVTLDAFARREGIEFVHVLKSDTQGFDFEVFKGAEGLMAEGRIALIYFEFIFSDMYQQLPPFHEVFKHLTERRFALVSFYESHYQRELVSWTDALFIHLPFHEKRMERLGK